MALCLQAAAIRRAWRRAPGDANWLSGAAIAAGVSSDVVKVSNKANDFGDWVKEALPGVRERGRTGAHPRQWAVIAVADVAAPPPPADAAPPAADAAAPPAAAAGGAPPPQFGVTPLRYPPLDLRRRRRFCRFGVNPPSVFSGWAKSSRPRKLFY